MEELALKYTADLPPYPPSSSTTPSPSNPYPPTILLTGSTGSLGSYILATLLTQHPAARIICFNRPPQSQSSNNGTDSDSAERQRTIMASRGLPTNFPATVSFITCDLAAPYLSLPKSEYERLVGEVTHVIHNAWSVNFLAPLEKFEGLIRGTRALVDFCIAAASPPARSLSGEKGKGGSRRTGGPVLFFTSTLGVGLQWPWHRNQMLPERLLSWDADPLMGYGRAKMVAEYVLSEASRVSGVRTVICRVGQVAGPTGEKGGWSPREWLPSLLASSVSMGVLPRSLGPADDVCWVPVDLLAEVIVELCFDVDEVDGGESVQAMRECEKEFFDRDVRWRNSVHEGEDDLLLRPTPERCTVFHTSNPQSISYAHLAPTIRSMLPPEIKEVPFQEWVVTLNDSSADLAHNPARRLAEMFTGLAALDSVGKGMVKLDTRETALSSKKLRAMPPISHRWMKGWMRQWGYGRFDRARL